MSSGGAKVRTRARVTRDKRYRALWARVRGRSPSRTVDGENRYVRIVFVKIAVVTKNESFEIANAIPRETELA